MAHRSGIHGERLARRPAVAVSRTNRRLAVMPSSDPDLTFSRFVRYCLVGVVNTLTDVAIFLVLTERLKLAAPANTISYSADLSVSFVLNRYFTFRHSAYGLVPAAQFGRFVGINLISLAGSTAMIWLLSTYGRPDHSQTCDYPVGHHAGLCRCFIVFKAKT